MLALRDKGFKREELEGLLLMFVPHTRKDSSANCCCPCSWLIKCTEKRSRSIKKKKCRTIMIYAPYTLMSDFYLTLVKWAPKNVIEQSGLLGRLMQIDVHAIDRLMIVHFETTISVMNAFPRIGFVQFNVQVKKWGKFISCVTLLLLPLCATGPLLFVFSCCCCLFVLLFRRHCVPKWVSSSDAAAVPTEDESRLRHCNCNGGRRVDGWIDRWMMQQVAAAAWKQKWPLK